jgi:hypothetical protein
VRSVRAALVPHPAAALAPLLAALVALAACSQSDDAAAATGRPARGSGPRAASIIAASRSPYRPTTVANGGSVRGVVELDGDAPRDTTVRPTRDEAVCGTSLTDRTTDRRGDRLGGVVVWLGDVRAGKVLPRARRFELTNERCQIVPRVQAAVVGGTLNVRNADATLHRTRFLRQEDGDVLALVSQTDAGQVVPVERVLVAPGLVEVRNDQHPWMRGWIAVFDHPYYGVTARDGAFAFDSVPPGTYRVVAWHERLGKVEQRVTIAAGKDSRVVIKLRGGED